MMRANVKIDMSLVANQYPKEKEYWLKKMSGHQEKCSFPYDYEDIYPGSIETKPIPNRVEFQLPEELVSRLIRLSNRSDQRLHVILAAGLVALLHKYTASRDIIIGSPVVKQETQSKFINTVLILRIQFEEDITFKELLIKSGKTIAEAAENVNYPLETLMSQLKLTVNRGTFSLFETAILLENIHDKSYIQHIDHNMCISFLKSEANIKGVWEYNPQLWREETIKRITRHFIYLLNRVVSRVDVPLLEIEILSQDEKKELLYDMNRTSTDYPVRKTLHELFQDSVIKTPHVVALVGPRLGTEDSPVVSLSYRQSNEDANRLARVIRARGVGPNTLVGIMVERSLEMITGILAVLKAGGGYLPIKPDTPPKRVLNMLADCQVPVLLTAVNALKKFKYSYLQHLDNKKLRVHKTGIRPQIKDLDAIPIPDRSMINYEKYSPYIGQTMVKNSITMQATRGCPYNCAYCHKIWPKSHVYRSAEHIFQEILTYYRMGVRRFSFIDDVFNLNKENSRKLFQLIIDNGLKVQIFFPAGLRGDILTRDYIDVMVKAGTAALGLALESASPRLQKLIGKNLHIEKLRETVDYFCETYPHVLIELFIMTGFPTETKDEALSTMEFVKNVKWSDFPYLSIVRIYSNTDMENIALASGIPQTAIAMSEHLAYHEIPHTLPFEKSFMSKYQMDFMNEYFLCKERLLTRLPYQMKTLTWDELLQKYDSYLPVPIKTFPDLLEFLGISPSELGEASCLGEEVMKVPDLHQKMKERFLQPEPDQDALRILLLDVSQYLTHDEAMLFDVVEPPLGLMCLLTYLNNRLGTKVNGKIAKSRIDFKNFQELQQLMEEFDPQVIGIRALTFYRNLFHQTAGVIRGLGINIPIIAGGPYATANYDEILQDRNIDLVVMGEGEITFCQLIEEIIQNKGKLPGDEVLKEIPGIAFVPGKDQVPPHWFAREILLFDTLQKQSSRQSGNNLENMNCSTDLAYAIYTSGSTGTPKAIFTQHYNVSRVVKNSNYLEIRRDDRLLQLSNFSFDGSVFDIYGALLNGAALVLVPPGDEFSGDKLSTLIKKQGITVFFITTALFNALVDMDIQCFNHIRLVLFGGERVSLVHSKKALEHMGKGRIIHMYGPTEITVYATYYYIDEIQERLGTIPIGKPISNTTIYIYDQNMRLTPPGVPGELYLGGSGTARGYLNQPELTQERFVQNPYIKGERIYRTGDLVRLLPTGDIVFLDRLDQQVKVRGFRIELGEIERVMATHEKISEVVVTRLETSTQQMVLAAYLKVTPQVSIDKESIPEELREYAARLLPDYMIPSFIQIIDEIPLLPNGKVDYHALPDPLANDSHLYIAPATELEKVLAKIWSGIIGIEKISINDNFFQLGGNSLNIMTLFTKIHQELNVKIPLAEFFNKPTIKEQSAIIESVKSDKFLSLETSEKKEYYALSPAQKRLYISQHVDQSGTDFNVTSVVSIKGNLDNDKLEKVFGKLLQRHESLRSSFQAIEGEIMQRVHNHEEFNFTITCQQIQQQQIKEVLTDFVHPFDLGRAPLLKAGIIKLEAEKQILMTDTHHIITDGKSMAILVDEFIQLYQDFALKPLRLQYRDYSQWQSCKKQVEAMERQQAYWLKEFEGHIPILNLPGNFQRPASQTSEGNTIAFEIPPGQTRELRELARTRKVTLFMILLAILNILLYKLSQQEDIAIGTVVLNRRHEDLMSIIGLFANTLVIRNFPRGSKTFTQFLAEVKVKTLAAFESQDFQFGNLVEELKIKRDPTRNPLFDVMFQMQNVEFPGTSLPGLNFTPYSTWETKTTAKLDMHFTATEEADSIFVTLNYKTRLFKTETIHLYIDYFKRTAAAIIENPGQILAEIGIMPGDKKQQAIDAFSYDLENE
jgi:amino acid adenylation domain-containing protein